jgi:hypothetical protein
MHNKAIYINEAAYVEGILVTGVTSLSTALSSEISVRGSSDTSLSTAISTENSTRSSGNISLSTAISTESSTRGSVDTSLSTSISNVINGSSTSNFIFGATGSGTNHASVIQNLFELPQYKSGFWDISGATWTPSTGWFWGLTMAHNLNTSGYNYSTQICSNYVAPVSLYTRNIYGGASPIATSWYKIWCANNDGADSGLDADLWDGYQFTDYLNQSVKSGSTPTFAGINFTGDLTVESQNTYDIGTTSAYHNQIYSYQFIAYATGSNIPAYAFNSDTNTGFYQASANWGNIGVLLDNVEEFRFAAGGTFHADADIVAYSSTVSSDRRLKENITNIDSGLSIIEKLNPVSFTWKEEKRSKDGVNFGLIAQEVEEVLPDIVKEFILLNLDEQLYKTIRYEQIIPFLIKSIQELKTELDNLKNKI